MNLICRVHFCYITETFSAVNAIEYFGVRLGSLRNASFGLTGDVWLVNSTALQITNLNLNPAKGKKTTTSFMGCR
jgi:hypothetical protein